MPSSIDLVRIFVASPGDVQAEREELATVIAELNRTIAHQLEARFDLIRWETDARPGFDVDAQAVINSQLPAFDIFVGIFWNRIGTPTGRSASGSVEEFERAYASFKGTGLPRIMLYFRADGTSPSNTGDQEAAAQKDAVEKLKSRVIEMGALFRSYETPLAFSSLVREHLFHELTHLLKSQGSRSGAGSSADASAVELAPKLDYLVEEFFSSCRNLVRTADDLHGRSDVYLAIPPLTEAIYRERVSFMVTALQAYNEAQFRIQRQKNDFEQLIRELGRTRFEDLRELASDALNRAMDFEREYDVPNESVPDFAGAFKNLYSEWLENRVSLGSCLVRARESLENLEACVVALASAPRSRLPAPRAKAAWEAVGLLGDYRRRSVAFGAGIETFLRADFGDAAEVRRAAWEMAPHIEAMNAAYIALEDRSLALRVSLLRSGAEGGTCWALAGKLSRAEKYQWHEVRPLLNSLLANVIAVVSGDDDAATLRRFQRQFPRWLELVRLLHYSELILNVSNDALGEVEG